MASQRIVSLVPSLTELLFDLGIGDRVAGRTRFCKHPDILVDTVPIIGGTKNPQLDKIRELKPDLIIANREENRKEDVEQLRDEFNVKVTHINTIEEALFTIHEIGELCGIENRAKELIVEIQQEMLNIPDESPLSTAYFIWRRPWMTVGSDTYIQSVLSHWKFENVYSGQSRYPKTSLAELSQKKPQLILLSSEPYPFKEKHINEVSEACPRSNIMLVNGEWFSWYGSRMLPSFRHLNIFRKAIS